MMKKLFFKEVLYAVLLVVMLEVWVRIFHLAKDNPVRIVDSFNVERWDSNQEGHSVTGNRRQNFVAFHLNDNGYNSYRDYEPTADKVEIALVGDSFIEGFHQDYNNSIGKKIEIQLPNIEVYEYGYAGYDMADQLHLISAYKETFDLIDHIVLNVKFSNDLKRASYTPLASRMRLEKPPYTFLRKSKLLIYCQSIGAFDPVKNLIKKISSTGKKSIVQELTKQQIQDQEKIYIKNLETLINTYGFDKKRFTFLLDSNISSTTFLTYLNKNNFNYIDINIAFKKATKPTTLIYDMHWNDYGRELVARSIADYYRKKIKSK